MGSGASSQQQKLEDKIASTPVVEVKLKHIFGKARGQEKTLRLRALVPPETVRDAEHRVHHEMLRVGFEPTESRVQHLVDTLIEFSAGHGYQVSNHNARRRPTVAQTLILSAARAIFAQYDTDRSGWIDVGELTSMVMQVHMAMKNAMDDDVAGEPETLEREPVEEAAKKIIFALDMDGNGYLDQDEFCDTVVRSLGWAAEVRRKNIRQLAAGDPTMEMYFKKFFDGVRFCIGRIIEATSESLIQQCLNPVDELDQKAVQLLAAERAVAEMEEAG